MLPTFGAAIMNRYVDYHKKKPDAFVFINEANMIKHLAKIDKHKNELTEKELNKITTMQKVNTTLISDGVGKDSRIRQLKVIARSL